MPGSQFEIHCAGCAAVHKIETGADIRDGKEWSYVQMACTECGLIVSQQVWEGEEPRVRRCGRCGGELSPWQGRVWHERTPEGHVGTERVEGPCPRCGQAITLADAHVVGQWD